jgi:hypothetical protein
MQNEKRQQHQAVRTRGAPSAKLLKMHNKILQLGPRN